MKKQEMPKNGAAILRFHVFLHRIPQPAMPFPKQLFVAPPVQLGVETQTGLPDVLDVTRVIGPTNHDFANSVV